MIMDGRSVKMDGQIKRECFKTMKLVASSICQRKGIVNVRMLYHLRELTEKGHLSSRIRRNVHSQLPEPLENLFILKTKENTAAHSDKEVCGPPRRQRQPWHGVFVAWRDWCSVGQWLDTSF